MSFPSRRSGASNRSQMPDEHAESFSDDFQKLQDDDSKCARLLKKIFREDRSYELKFQRIQEFEMYLEKSDSNKFLLKLAQPALNLFFEHFRERSTDAIRDGLAHCIGKIGFVMLKENQPKFADWIFDRLNDVRRNDVQRELLIKAFRRSIANENEVFALENQIVSISEQLKKILESVVYAPLMIVLTNTILDLSQIYPQVFHNLFVDIVDILIGWYIEPLPTDRILDFTGEALKKFRPFWLEQLETTTLTLLDQFIEDADNYAQQVEQKPNEFDDENLSLIDKIAALYRAFGTVLRALSDDFGATPNLLPFDFVENSVQKILHTCATIRRHRSFGLVAKNANLTLNILFENFQKLDEHFQDNIFDFVIEQTKIFDQKWPYEADGNLLRFIFKLVELISHESCAKLTAEIFAPRSRLWSYRFFHSNSVKIMTKI